MDATEFSGGEEKIGETGSSNKTTQSVEIRKMNKATKVLLIITIVGVISIPALWGTAAYATLSSDEVIQSQPLASPGTWEVIDTIQLSGTQRPLQIAISGGRAYISRNPDHLTVLDLSTNTAVTTIKFDPYPGAAPHYIGISGGKAYVALGNLGSDGQLAVINISNNTVSGYIPVGADPYGVATLGQKVYVTNNVWWASGDPATVKEVNTNTNSVVATIPVGVNPTGIAIDPATSKAYVANHNDLSKSVSVINTASNSVTKTIPINNPPAGVAISGNRAYVTTTVNMPNGSVEVIDIGTDTVISSIPVGRDSWGIAASGSYVFVANQASDTVSVIDIAANTVVSTLNVGDDPTHLAVDPTTNRVYVANQGDNTISILAPSGTSQPSTQAPTAYIDSILPSPATQGETVSFDGHGNDPDGSVVGYNWRSSVDGQLSTSASFSTSSLSAGTHTIYFKVEDNDRLWSPEVNKTITINAPTYPDLIVQDITWTPPNPSIGDTVTFTVAIKNKGGSRAGSSRVYLYIDGSSKGYQTVEELDAGAAMTKTFTWTAQAGSHNIKVVADGSNYVSESDENNNEKTLTYSATALPDLVIESITWSPTNPSIGDTVTFTVTIKNRDTGRGGTSRVYLYIDGSSKGYQEVQEIDANGTITETFSWKAQAGSHDIKAVIDKENWIPETDENNNDKNLTFTATLLPDLIIETITWSPENPSIGDTVTFTVKVRNQGGGSASSSRVYFYIDGSSKGYQEIPEIDAGTTVTGNFNWKAEAGSHAVKAIVDKDNWIPESDENNNQTTVNYSATSLPDLIIENITWKPSSPSVGDTVTFTIAVKNKGNGRAGASRIYLYIDDSSKGYKDVQEIDAGNAVTGNFNWKAEIGPHAVKAIADKENWIPEIDENNNENIVTYSTIALPPSASPPTPVPAPVPAPSPTPQPELEPGQPYVSLYGHRTNVTVGEEIILYLSTVNPITSPGTLVVQLTLSIPSGWSITSSGFGHGAGGLRTNTYDIGQGPNPQEIDVHILANESFEGDVIGYMDYYFKGDEETKYHSEARLPVTAKLAQTTEPAPKKDGGLSCSGPAQAAPLPSHEEVLLGLSPIALCWGGIAGLYGILRWRKRKRL